MFLQGPKWANIRGSALLDTLLWSDIMNLSSTTPNSINYVLQQSNLAALRHPIKKKKKKNPEKIQSRFTSRLLADNLHYCIMQHLAGTILRFGYCLKPSYTIKYSEEIEM